MGYRSTRFDPGELSGLRQAWETIDLLANNHIPVVSEVMAGRAYRRPLHPDAAAALGDVDYVLQACLEPAPRGDGRRVSARKYVELSNEILGAIRMPGETAIDTGGLHGWDITTTKQYPFGTGQFETECLAIYPPWLQARWSEAGKQLMFFCGIQPPHPRFINEEWLFKWSDEDLRQGRIVFSPTPVGLETW